MASGCPFGGRKASLSSPRPLHETNRDATVAGGKLPTGRRRVQLLYEEYVHLPLLRQVWERPTTERPVLEPLFAAGFHGIELAFLLLAEFVSDSRRYVAKRPRVELVADDIIAQCRLLTEVVDAELEEELAEGEGPPTSRLSLTQPFPFEGCPPTTAEPCHSPGLRRLTEAVQAKLGGMSSAERNSVIKLVINITSAFSSFQRWTVGLGIEHQLQALQTAVGLQPTQYPHRLNLDYDSLVRPWLCEQTLTCETYTYAEDFFFRTIHLGTDCWAFVALSRLASARQLAMARSWHAAAARTTQAARILDYLGDHVLLLTSMNLRDYLRLKVELEGTSGEGSVQVKNLRGAVAQLLAPLEAALLGTPVASPPAASPPSPAALSSALGAGSVAGPGSVEQAEQEGAPQDGSDPRQEALQQALMGLYEFPDRGEPGLYNYCRALEVVETGLLGGFYYKHYCLATNVIGTEARGTMRRAVAALKAGYETQVFPQLDRCRVALGARLDAELADRKGRIMQGILKKVAQQGGQQAGAPKQEAALGEGGATAGRRNSAEGLVSSSGGCPFGQRRAVPPAPDAASNAALEPPSKPVAAAAGGDASGSNGNDLFEAARQAVYGWEGVPPGWRHEVAAELAQQAQQLGLAAPSSSSGPGSQGGVSKPLALLDHAWGQLAPLAQYRAWREAAALCQLGNPAWDVLFGQVMPQAAVHIKSLLGLPSAPDASADGCTVQFGSNSHELVSRLLSTFLDRGRLLQGPPGQEAGRGQAGQEAGHRPVSVSPRSFEEGHACVSSEGGTGTDSEGASGGGSQPRTGPLMRVLTSDTEFYSITRQLNRLAEAGLADVEAVPAEPVATFPQRCCAAVAAAAAAGCPFDVVYVSQTAYLTQQTLVPDIPAFVRGLRSSGSAAAVPVPAAAGGGAAAGDVAVSAAPALAELPAQAGDPAEAQEQPLIIIDGYHGFCALPTSLAGVEGDCCYVAGLLKHAGCGANCAFMTLPSRLAARPVLTGWLADPAVLAADSAGIQLGSEVGYCSELALQGGTPAFMLPLLTFNQLMRLWREAGPTPVTVEALHGHVMQLHQRFLEGLDAAGHPFINTSTLLPPQDPTCRSHTLVYRLPDAPSAKVAVEGLASQGVLVDTRRAHVRLGFGPNHSAADVDTLLSALRSHA